MSRPIYETDEQRAAEREIAERAATHFRCHAIMLPKKAGADVAFERDGELQSFAEVKDRPGWGFGDGDGLRLSERKVERIEKLREITLTCCLLIVRFADGIIRWCYAQDYKPGITVTGGRTDRGDKADVEKMRVYPWRPRMWHRIP